MKNNVVVRRSPGPMECVRMFFSRTTDFKGRSRRDEYGWGLLVTYVGYQIVIALFSTFIVFMYGVNPDPSKMSEADVVEFLILCGIMLVLMFLWALITIVPVTSLSVRRLHDIGWSGETYIPFFIGFCIPLVNIVAAIAWWIIALRDSSPEVNKWGESPKYPAPETPA